jgi:hypothetical protein
MTKKSNATCFQGDYLTTMYKIGGFLGSFEKKFKKHIGHFAYIYAPQNIYVALCKYKWLKLAHDLHAMYTTIDTYIHTLV